MSRRLGVIGVVTALVASAVGVCYAASFTLTTAKLGAAAVTTQLMFPDQVILANKTGQQPGRADNGDTVTLVFSRQVDEPTMCSNWSNTSSSQSVKPQYSIVPGTGGANDTFVVSGPAPSACTGGFHIGTIDLGATGYDTTLTKTLDFPSSNSVLTVGAATTTLVITLAGRKNGTAGIVPSGGPATWTPDSGITDRSGNSCAGCVAVTSSTTQF